MVVAVKLDTDPRLGLDAQANRVARGIVSASTSSNSRDYEANGFSAILACYPVAIQLAAFLDLNTLHSLSRTCHLIRALLLQHRKGLISKTLRCSNEALDVPEVPDGTAFSRYQSWDVAGSHGVSSIRITSGKVGPCARDLVGECRRCDRVVCRNCIMKAPPTPMLPKRHRRLCTTCAKAPLATLLSNPIAVTPSTVLPLPPLTRQSCSCAEEVFVCQSCGHAISSADVNYRRVWEWRSRYSTYLGGLGTGIGEGNEGVQCVRDDLCLAAKEIEVEVDSRSEDFSGVDWMPVDAEDGRNGTTLEAVVSESGEKAGYMRQEIEGIGGVLTTKFKKRVRVGMAVEEHEGERACSESYLGREVRGESRSWCGWCNRVILGRLDEQSPATC